MEDWEYPDSYIGEAYDLSKIKEMPISFYVGGNDTLCTPERVEWYASFLSTVQNHFVFTGMGHNVGSLKSDDFLQLLYNEVDDPLFMGPRYAVLDPENIEVPDVPPPPEPS